MTGAEVVSRSGPPLSSPRPGDRGRSLSQPGSVSTNTVYSNVLPRRQTAAARTAGPVKTRPPFLTPVIAVTVPVEDCSQYMFQLDMLAPGTVKVRQETKLERLRPPQSHDKRFCKGVA